MAPRSPQRHSTQNPESALLIRGRKGSCKSGIQEEQGSLAPKNGLIIQFHHQVGKIISEMYVRRSPHQKHQF